MKECCANCSHLFEMEDWTDYPNGQYFRKVCGLYAKESFVMALFGTLTGNGDLCEEFSAKYECADTGT